MAGQERQIPRILGLGAAVAGVVLASAVVIGLKRPQAGPSSDHRSRSRASSFLPATLGLIVGLTLLIAPFLPLSGPSPAPMPALSPTVPVAIVATPTPAPPTPTPTALATAPGSAMPTAAPTLTPTPTPRPAPPTRLRIPSVDIDGPIIPVGIKPSGELEAPREALQVGWFAEGVRPGERGNALLDGHLDWYLQAGIFWALRNVNAGDEVVVVGQDGHESRFRVEWKRLYPVENAPVAEIFGPTEEPALTLITCGGQFDRSSQSYTHRWVVRATAILPTPPANAW
ncbi:MAG: class F sortase [Chloroflexota bacterium]